MKKIQIQSGAALSRRTFLRGSGIALALPLLDAMTPALASVRPSAAAGASPRRLLAVMTNMGKLPGEFFPEKAGRDYALSPYLRVIEEHRDDFTVMSGISHPEVDGGHHAEVSFLTGAPHPGQSGFRNTISLDQFAAERLGVKTRFPSLALEVGTENSMGLSWTASGAPLPAENRPSRAFQRLFFQGSRAEVEAQIQRLRDGRSILDLVAGRARKLGREVGPGDAKKLDQYFTSVRELEQRLLESEAWEKRPRPQVEAKAPVDIDDRTELIGRTRLMFQVAKLALQTDSTRIITLRIDQNANPKVNLPGVTQGHHSLTHHGSKKETLEQLQIIETEQMRVFGELLGELKASKDSGGSLLDHTMVLYGSNLGNANSHDNRNLPVLLAGGGFRHGQHLAFDRHHNVPLANLYVSMLQRLGLEVERFASSTGTLSGLELRS